MSSNEMKKELRAVLYDYRKMTGPVERRLKALGFETVRTSRHNILRFCINGKTFQFSLSSTSSDNRSGKNLVSKIYQTLKDELDAGMEE